jgi:gamma-glutamyltranspeptidase/glutathione hydrolase
MHLAKFALQGPQITEYQAQCLNRLKQKLSHSPESRRIFVKSKGQYHTGEYLPNSNLGRSFEILSKEGEKAFYSGEIAESLEEDLVQNGGFITVRDLAGYAVHEVHPIRTEINGYTVWTVPPEGGGATEYSQQQHFSRHRALHPGFLPLPCSGLQDCIYR